MRLDVLATQDCLRVKKNKVVMVKIFKKRLQKYSQ